MSGAAVDTIDTSTPAAPASVAQLAATAAQTALTDNTAATEANTAATVAANAGPAAPVLLTQSEWTRRAIALSVIITVCLATLSTVGVICYRVIIDGNSAISNDMASKLTIIALVCLGSMVTAIFGANSLVGKTIDKLL